MLNGAIIGFGKIARTNHLPAYQNVELKERLRITSVVEPNKFNLEKSKAEYPEIHFYDSLEKLFENENIDFVDIASPPLNHFELLEKCIQKNVHIICEKPFTVSLSHAEKIREMLLASDKVFIPCHQYKYSPIWKKFKDFINANSANAGMLLQFNVFRTEADPGLQQISDKWRERKTDLGGGILADTGVHYLYLAAWMLNNINKITTKLLNIGQVVFESEDTALITLEGENGVAQITLTWTADKRFNSANVTCSKSSIYYQGCTELVENTNQGMKKILIPDMSDKTNYTVLYVSLFLDFINAVDAKEKHADWINEAYESVKLMNLCYKSSKDQKTIIINDEK